MWDALRLDVRHALRGLRRAPTFSAIVIVTLTLAVGATTAVGSLLNAVVLRTLAVPEAGQLVAMSALEPRANVSGYFYADTVKAYRAAQRSFSQLSMYSGGGLARVETRSGVFDASTETVSPGYFELVGARLSAGRFFTEADEAVVVITEGYRRRIYGNGPGIGEVIKFDAMPATVIGVVADGFQGLQSDGATDIIVPFALIRAASGDASRPFRSATVVGRLARGVSIESARAELLTTWPSIQSATLPAALRDADREGLLRQRLTMEPLASGFSGLRGRYGTTLWVLLALVGILLAVACANLAGLTLARSLTRTHQVAVRLALGGSRRRVSWQLLVDGLLLSVVAFAGAIPLAWVIIRAITASLMVGRGRLPVLMPDGAVLTAMALLTVVIGLAIGVASAWRAVAVHPARLAEGLRPARALIGSLGPFGRGLLVAQLALSMTLLVGAGLFVATLAHLRANDTSLQSQRIVFSRAFREPGDRALLPPDYYRNLVSGLARMPGADAAALSVYYPTYFGVTGPLPTDYHYTRADGIAPIDAPVLTEFVSPGFFELFRLARLSGRDVSWDDGLEKPAVALLSASLAGALFPAGNAVGQQIRIAGPQRRGVEIIGVVADAPYGRLDDPRPLVVFRPIMQEVARAQFPMAYVRATGDLGMVRDGYARVVKSLGHRSLRPIFLTSSEWVDRALLQERFTAGMATFAAALTILLACIGVYGLLAYSVTARVREIGVRLALGAGRATVVWMVVRDGLAIAVPGVLIGGLCAWGFSRLVRAQLYGIAPNDPRTLLIAAAVFLMTVLAASLLPALRASRVAPAEALRDD